MSRRAALAGLAAFAGAALLPSGVAAHAIGSVYTLPVPRFYYLVGAGLAVAASFVVAVLLVRPPSDRPHYPTAALPVALARIGAIVLQLLGLVWWLGTILIGYLVDPISPLPAVLLWIGIWVGLPLVAILLGNPWPSLSPFRTLYALLESGARLVGVNRLDLGLRYPPVLGRWPAVFLLVAGGFGELVLQDHTVPLMVANLMIGYTVITLLGMVLFGRVAWLRNVELFEVLLGWFGRIGPLGRRAVAPEVCDGCSEGCDPERCIDCQECAAAAESGERRLELRPWFTGLVEVRVADWSDAGFIILALATVTYDGLSETAFWARLTNPFFNALWDVLGPYPSVLIVQTAGLLAIWLFFMLAFSVALWATRALHDPGRRGSPFGQAAGIYASTLLPIAGGYFIAHYLTVVLQSAVWLPQLVADPLNDIAPTLDWLPASAIWYLSVGAIVLGHVVAVVLAHRLALRDARLRPIVAGLPLVALMVAYTILSLWIIAQPLTLEPGTVPAAFVAP